MAAERVTIEKTPAQTFAQEVAVEQSQFVSLMNTIESDHLKVAKLRGANLKREYERDAQGNKTDKFSYVPILPEQEEEYLEKISRLNHFKDAARCIHWGHQVQFANSPKASDTQKAQLLADAYWGTRQFVIQRGEDKIEGNTIDSMILDLHKEVVEKIQITVAEQPDFWKDINTTGKVPLPKAA